LIDQFKRFALAMNGINESIKKNSDQNSKDIGDLKSKLDILGN
jgi:hypothetical protein